MTEPSKKTGCRGCLKFFLIGFVLFIAFICIWTYSAVSQRPQPGRPLFKPNAAANHITSPLNANGDVDYVEHVNERSTDDVLPENNAAIPLVRAIGPATAGPEFFSRLGMETLPEKGEYFVAFQTWYSDQTQSNAEAEAAAQSTSFIDLDLEATGSEAADAIRAEYDFVSKYGLSSAEAREQFAIKHCWTPDELPKVAEYLRQMESHLELVAEAAARPRYYYPKVAQSSSTLLLSVLLPHQQEYRRLAESLILRSNLHLGNDDVDAAIGDAELIVQLGQRISDCDFLVEFLIAVSIRELGLRQLAIIAKSPNISREQLERLRTIAWKLESPEATLDLTSNAERMSTLDAMQSLFRGDQEALSALGQENYGIDFVLSTADSETAMKFINEHFDRMLAILEASKTDPKAIEKFELEMDALQSQAGDPAKNLALMFSSRRARGIQVGKIFAGMMFPAVQFTFKAERRGNSKVQLLRLIIELELFQRQHGSYPKTLDELVSDRLATVPTDPANYDAAFYYAPTDETYRLYSLGPNQKDDGGSDPWTSQLETDDYELTRPAPVTWQKYLQQLSGEPESPEAKDAESKLQ